MFRLFVLFICVTFGLSAKEITPSDVFSDVNLIGENIHFLLKHYDINHHHEEIMQSVKVKSVMKPRNVWQKTYEIMIKINILRNNHGLPTIEPVGMPPVLNLNPDLVYEQTQRILNELKIFAVRNGVEAPNFEKKRFINKTPSDVFIGLSHLSLALDELSGEKLTQSYIFGENMRVYDDISLILDTLGIEDKTIPAKKHLNATMEDTFDTAIKTLEKIKQLQISVGIDFVDFSGFKKEKVTVSDVFSISEMIIAELQTIKAYLGITKITPASLQYETKTQIEVEQIMSWNFRKLSLINSLLGAK